jgi:hypothetical protein
VREWRAGMPRIAHLEEGRRGNQCRRMIL